MKYYNRMTVEEFNLISNFTHKVRLDEVVDIMHDDTFGDYFYDFEEEMKIPFEEGIECIVDNIGSSGYVYCELNSEYRNMIYEFVNKYSIDRKKKEYVKKVNEILDKKNTDVI